MADNGERGCRKAARCIQENWSGRASRRMPKAKSGASIAHEGCVYSCHTSGGADRKGNRSERYRFWSEPHHQQSIKQKDNRCVFRRDNVLFSDKFCERYAQHRDSVARGAMDTRSTGVSSSFWSDVTTVSNEGNEQFNAKVRADGSFVDTDPASFRQHDGKKLWFM